MVIDDNFFMNLALKEAWRYQVLTYPNPAVGCCVVNGTRELLSVEAHHQAGEAHAEVLALQSAYYQLTKDNNIFLSSSSQDIQTYLILNHNNCFKNSTLYVTLEPCSHVGKTPSCAHLISELHVREVIILTLDKTDLASGGEIFLNKSNIQTKYSSLHVKGMELLYPFLKYNKGGFVFFKWAQCLNGATNCGIISSKDSHRHVHAMRHICDLLIIGGGTVRADRPILDARMVDGKAPDILIFSRNKEFDREIPLFNVIGRKVFIEDNFEKIKAYKNIMIEGTQKMYTLTRDIVDYYLCYLTPLFGVDEAVKFDEDKFKFLNVNKESEDIIVWMKRK